MTAATYAGRLRALVDYVRFYAPKAAIRIVGYPELFADGAHNLCTNVAGTKITKPQTRGGGRRRVVSAKHPVRAADILGTGFVDARAVTAGHGMCSTDPWVRGVMYPARSRQKRSWSVTHRTRRSRAGEGRGRQSRRVAGPGRRSHAFIYPRSSGRRGRRV